MNVSIVAPHLSGAITQLKEVVIQNEQEGVPTVIFCEDRLTLACERAVCSAVGGSFLTSVYTFARFLSTERGARGDIISAQGSAMVIRHLIEENASELKLFKKLSASTSAQALYDTIAVLYASRVSPEDLQNAQYAGGNGQNGGTLLQNKLHDISLLYRLYNDYLNAHGVMDRNSYLRLLPDAIKNSPRVQGARVVLFGFQSFTHSVSECVHACMATASQTIGLFMGGKQDLYTNEASASFYVASQDHGGCVVKSYHQQLSPEAEHIRQHLFDPESFHLQQAMPTDKVFMFAGVDQNEELEFTAATIKRLVSEGTRYGKISVMVPDVASLQSALERVFGSYRIPYYADCTKLLAEHPLCNFIIDYLTCVWDGCTLRSVDSVIASPLFGLTPKDRDICRNYLVRLATYRGAIKREPNQEACQNSKFDYDAVMRVRDRFLHGLNLLKPTADKSICTAIKQMLDYFGMEDSLQNVATLYQDRYPMHADFSARVYDKLLAVLDEADELTQEYDLSLKEMVKVLKSGFASCEISLIPPKADAVFVGDLDGTVNTGTDYVFALGLTSAIPVSGADTALLTDREIDALAQLQVNVSPKIHQVNLRQRELVALNICSFRKGLFLSYPTAGGNNAPSEVLLYMATLFCNAKGDALSFATQRQLDKSDKAVPFYCSEKLPAVKRLVRGGDSGQVSSIYQSLVQNNCQRIADLVLAENVRNYHISTGKRLFSVAPSSIESYFRCPYRSFMQNGIYANEREEQIVRVLDVGNFVHAVLQKIAPFVNGAISEQDLHSKVQEVANDLLDKPPFSTLTQRKQESYTRNDLLQEVQTVADGMYQQIKNSTFQIAQTECVCSVKLDDRIRLSGRIDRVDVSDDMVRVIDYKTGKIDGEATDYYMGVKLQVPLYLLAVSQDKRPVGAYYFPASVGYEEDHDGVFRMEGFMDGSDEVLKATDVNVQPKQKSLYVNANYQGRAVKTAMDKEDFADFVEYSRMIALQGATEMQQGNIQPSPIKKACGYCPYASLCGFDSEVQGERENAKIDCKQIAEIVRKRRLGDEC